MPSSQEEREVLPEVKLEVVAEVEERVEVEGVENEVAIKAPKKKSMNLVRFLSMLNKN